MNNKPGWIRNLHGWSKSEWKYHLKCTYFQETEEEREENLCFECKYQFWPLKAVYFRLINCNGFSFNYLRLLYIPLQWLQLNQFEIQIWNMIISLGTNLLQQQFFGKNTSAQFW